jgi:hypothetical protein
MNHKGTSQEAGQEMTRIGLRGKLIDKLLIEEPLSNVIPHVMTIKNRNVHTPDPLRIPHLSSAKY